MDELLSLRRGSPEAGSTTGGPVRPGCGGGSGADPAASRHPDLVGRVLGATGPDQPWVRDCGAAMPRDSAPVETVDGCQEIEVTRGPAHRGRWESVEEVQPATRGRVPEARASMTPGAHQLDVSSVLRVGAP